MKNLRTIATCISFAIALTVVVFPHDALARDNNSRNNASAKRSNKSKSDKQFQPPAVCTDRLAGITTRTSTLRDRVGSQLSVIDKVYSRTVEYATEHSLTDKIFDYAAINSRISDTKSAAADQSKSFAIGADAFACNSSYKQAAATLRKQAAAQRDALNDYRNAVKTLIVGVKQAAGQGQ